MGKTNFLNSLHYTDHDHLSNGGERTQISGTQNKVQTFSSVLKSFFNTSERVNAAATDEPCSRPDAA